MKILYSYKTSNQKNGKGEMKEKIYRKFDEKDVGPRRYQAYSHFQSLSSGSYMTFDRVEITDYFWIV